MQITRDNYAVFILDYYEGKLTDADCEALLRFLDSHPDLKEEFDRFEMVRLEGDEVIFPGKDSLKKPVEESAPIEPVRREQGREITLEEAVSAGYGLPVSGLTPTNYELYFAAYVEGDLDPPTMAAVEAFAASDKRYARELSLMKQSHFVPGTEVTYPHKGTLKQHQIPALEHSGSNIEEEGGTTIRFLTRRRIWNAASVAAAVLFLAMLTFTIFPEHEGIQVATHDGAPPVAEDKPVGGDTEHPLAVADALTPQPPATSSLRSDDATSSLRSNWKLAPEAPEKLASRIEPITTKALPLPDISTQAHTQVRDEFYWMAAVDPSQLFLEEEEVHGGGRREVSLAQLAVGQVEERTGIRVGEAGEALPGDRTSLLELAGRGLSGLNNLIGQPVVVDGETTEDGRRIAFALGDFIQVSRK